ncbi:hypothetical protein ACQP10_37825 (plasmid) [Streptosporangium sandarakinum]|uniref:hypothetical protein n=1 Tax=Streptosporangium sandarakinum TaxID=1260955 RepID=UPI003D8C161A
MTVDLTIDHLNETCRRMRVLADRLTIAVQLGDTVEIEELLLPLDHVEQRALAIVFASLRRRSRRLDDGIIDRVAIDRVLSGEGDGIVLTRSEEIELAKDLIMAGGSPAKLSELAAMNSARATKRWAEAQEALAYERHRDAATGQTPAWIADDPYPGAPDGPHWQGCERSHPRCAYLLGVAHGRAQSTPREDTMSTPDGYDYGAVDTRERTQEAEDRRALHGAAVDELGDVR